MPARPRRPFMEEPFRELARRDAKAIRGGMALTAIALVIGVVSLFAGAIAGFVAVLAAGLVQLNVAVRLARRPTLDGRATPRARPRRRWRASRSRWARMRSSAGSRRSSRRCPAAVLATIVVGMTLAARRA